MEAIRSSTMAITEEPISGTSESIRVTLRKPDTDANNANHKKVAFTEETVDNENLNRKKSKCCCIYEKQRLFGESSSEDEGDDDCPDHCHGRKKYHKKPNSHDNDQKDEDHQE